MSRSITISTRSGPYTLAEISDFSALSEPGQYNNLHACIIRTLEDCDQPNSPGVAQLVDYGNRLVQNRNRRFPQVPSPYILVRQTNERLSVSNVPTLPSIPIQLEQPIARVAIPVQPVAPQQDGDLSEEEQLAFALALSFEAQQHVEVKQHEAPVAHIAPTTSVYNGLPYAELLQAAREMGVEVNELNRIAGRENIEELQTLVAIHLSRQVEQTAHDVTIALGDRLFGATEEKRIPVDGFVTSTENLYDTEWCITRYSDGTSCINGTWVSSDDKPIRGQGINGEGPYCFLIALWHNNQEFMLHRDYKSPWVLFSTLLWAGKITARYKMFERDSILPVAEFLDAKVTVTILDRDEQDEVGSGTNMLFVTMRSLKERHYVSGTELHPQ